MIRVICQYGAVGLAAAWGLIGITFVVDGGWRWEMWEVATGLVLLLWLARLLWL